MSGIYGNWIKPQYPFMSNDIPQMRSEGFQQPFFFGASNIPNDLGLKSNITGGSVALDANGKIMKPAEQGVSRQITGFSKKSRVLKPRKIKHLV